MSSKAMKIGHLAQATGLTVRTLHWYDQIGLLKPSLKTESGHRLYSPSDIARLQQIKSLQELGFGLKEIGGILSRPELRPEEVIGHQLKLLNDRINHQIRLRQRLESLAGRYRTKTTIAVSELLKTIKDILQMEKYYTKEQLEKLRQRRESLGEETIFAAEAEWKELFRKYEAEMKKGTDPSSEPVQKLAKRSWELIDAFTGRDSGIEKSLGNMYRQAKGGPDVMAQHGIQLDPRVWEYMGQAMQAFKRAPAEK